LLSRKQAATDAGLSDDQRKQALRIANIPQESFEEQIEADRPPTLTERRGQRTAMTIGGTVAARLNE
jgi:hypothetical protein